jgi:hypothetical protein
MGDPSQLAWGHRLNQTLKDYSNNEIVVRDELEELLPSAVTGVTVTGNRNSLNM